MDENEIMQRLRDAGDRPVPGEVRASHLSHMHAATPPVERPRRFGRLAVAAAAFAGFAVGSTGFAMAGALPDPAQQVAHDVLAVVQIDVENPKNRGQCIANAARTIADEGAKETAKEDCKAAFPPGRPDHAGPPEGVGQGRPDGAGPPDGLPHEGNECKGPPPWAGKGGKSVTPQEKQAFEDTRAACPPDVDDENEVGDEQAEELEAEEIEPPAPQDQPGGPEQAPSAEQDPAEQDPAEQDPAEQDPADQGPANQGMPGEAPAGPPADGAPAQPGDDVAPVVPPAEADPNADAEEG